MKVDYFLIRLNAQYRSSLSIHKNQRLTENDYHPMPSEETVEYLTITPVTSTIENMYYDLPGEPYENYLMQSIEFKKVNDFATDGFWYDPEHEVVVYGHIPGIYAGQRADHSFYDLFTKKVIPWSLIYQFLQMETEEDFKNMIQDLEFIRKYRSAYVQLTQERLNKLEAGVDNLVAARERYDERLQEFIHGIPPKSQLAREHVISSYKEKVKELIAGSKNN